MPAVIGFAGSSGSGKTTLIAKLVPLLQIKGWRVAVIKHDGHGHYKETEGTDSSRFIEAGADCVIVSGRKLTARFEGKASEPGLEELLLSLPPVDLVLVEGYKQSPYPKIAIMLREEHSDVLERLDRATVMAVAAGFGSPKLDGDVKVLDLHEPRSIVDFIETFMLI